MGLLGWLNARFGKGQRKPKIGEIAPVAELQKKYGLYAENRPWIRLNPENVPSGFRDLIPYAEKWGIGDDAIRGDYEEKAPGSQKKELGNVLRGRTREINEWLDSLKSSMSDEAAAFMYMLSAAAEMDVYPPE